MKEDSKESSESRMRKVEGWERKVRESLVDERRMYSLLEEATRDFPDDDAELRTRKSGRSIYRPKRWVTVITVLDAKLDEIVRSLVETRTEEGLKRLDVILGFAEKYFRATQYRQHAEFLNSLLSVLKLEDLDLNLRALKLMDLCSRKANTQIRTFPAYREKANIGRLKHLALGFNLRTNKKTSYVTALKEPISEVLYQYYSVSSLTEGSVSSIRTINLSHLSSSTKDAQTEANEIGKEANLPDEQLQPLWCKVRLAKNAGSSEGARKLALISLLACKILLLEVRDEPELRSFISEAELKMTLIQDLILLLKYPGASPEIHNAALEILTTLVDASSRYRAILRDTGGELETEASKHLGLNSSTNGLIHSMLRDATGLQVVFEEKTMVVRPPTRTEVLSQATAESPLFLYNLLDLLDVVSRTRSREDLNYGFWAGIKTSILSMLNIEEGGYAYRVPNMVLGMELLHKLSVLRGAEQDITDVDTIIKRLSYEIRRLREKEPIFYPVSRHCPSRVPAKLEDRQELCNELAKLLTSSITQHRPRMLMMEEEGMDDELGFRYIPFGAQMIRPERRESNDPVLREARRRFGRHPGQGQGQDQEQEQQEEREEDPAEEVAVNQGTVAVSRRVLESEFMVAFCEIFTKAGSTQATLLEEYVPIIHPLLSLLSSIMKDIPTAITDSFSKTQLEPILRILKSYIPPGPNYFNTILSALESMCLNKNTAKIASSCKVVTKLIRTLIEPEFIKHFPASEARENSIQLSAHLIRNLFVQAADLKGEIVDSFRMLLEALEKNCVGLVRDYSLLATKSGKSGKSAEQKFIEELEEKTREKSKVCGKAFQIVLTLLRSFVSNIPSREHLKFVSALNAKDAVVSSTVRISKLAVVLEVVCPQKYRKYYERLDLSHIIRFYVGESRRFERMESQSSEHIMEAEMNSMVKRLSTTLGIEARDCCIGDLATGKKVMPLEQEDEIVKSFNSEDRILFVFGNIEWMCMMVKVIGKVMQKKYESYMGFLCQLHMLLLKEAVRLYADKNDLGSEDELHSLKELGDQSALSISATDSILASMLEHLETRYERGLLHAYNSVRLCLSEIAFSSFKTMSRYEHMSSGMQGEVYRSLGKYVTRFIVEALSIRKSLPTKDKFSPESRKVYQVQLFQMIMLLKDMEKLCINEFLSLPQIFEIYKERGLTNLQVLYQSLVLEVIELAAQPDPNQSIAEELRIVLTIIIRFFATIMNPRYLAIVMSQIHRGSEIRELAAMGFKTNEDFLASVLTYSVEAIIHRTDYKDHKTAVRFLAEHVRPGFILFLDVIRKYPNKETIARLIQKRGGAEEYLESRRQRQEQIPPSMTEELVLMGFDVAEAEEALRRNDLNVEASITDIFRMRNEAEQLQNLAFLNPASIVSGSEIRKIEIKDLPSEVERWLEAILRTLYEGLYSISSYQCKYLLFSLIEFQSLKRLYKIRHAFAFLLNELQTLLFSIELSYEFCLIPNDEFPISELAEVSMSEKLGRKIKKYSEQGTSEAELVVLHKMSALIDVTTTFLRLSKTNELLKMMCDYKIGECLIVVLTKLVQSNLILPGRKLLPKVLLLLSMIYKETYQQMQSESLDLSMKQLTGAGPDKNLSVNALLGLADIKKLIEILTMLVNLDGPVSEKLTTLKKRRKALLTNELVTTILLLLTHLTKDEKNAQEVSASEVVTKLFELKQVPGVRHSVPNGLVTELMFNLLESQELLGKFMERMISQVLFARVQWRNRSAHPSEEELAKMQKESAMDVDRFLNSLGFLMTRNSFAFFQACKKVAQLRNELQKEPGGKVAAKYMISLKTERVLQLVRDNNFSVVSQTLSSSSSLQKAIRESMDVLKPCTMEILSKLIGRLISYSEEFGKPAGGPAVPIEDGISMSLNQTVEILTHAIRIFPESISVFLTYTGKSKECSGASFLGFLISQVLPLPYLVHSYDELRVRENEEWRRKTVQLFKCMAFENINVHELNHRMLIAEARRKVVRELLKQLRHINSRAKREKRMLDPRAVASAYSCLAVLEELLISESNTVLFPKENQYRIMREMFQEKEKLLAVFTKLLRNCNLHSAQSKLIASSVAAVLERITRIRKLDKMIKEEELPQEPPHKEEEEDVGDAEEDEEMIPEEPGIPVEHMIMEGFEGDIINPPEMEEAVENEPGVESEGEEPDLPPAEEEAAHSVSNSSSSESSPSEGSDVPEEEEPDEEIVLPVDERHGEEELIRGSIGEMMMPLGDEDDEEFGGSFSLRMLELRRRALQSSLGINLDSLRMMRGERPRRADRAAELDTVPIHISGEPADSGKTKDVTMGLSHLYTRDSESEINKQIIELLKGEVLGEEKHQAEPEDRPEYEDLDYFLGRDRSRDRVRENEEGKELPQISLYGYNIDKQKATELMKNQIIGGLETKVVDIEEEKMAEAEAKAKAVPVPPDAKQEENKEEGKEEGKEEEKKEEKKEEKRERSVPELAQLITSMLGARVEEVKKEEEGVQAPEVKREEEGVQAPEEKKEVAVGTGPVESMEVGVGAPEQKREEEKKGATEEQKRVEAAMVNLGEAFITQRRTELARLIPGLQIEDNNVLMQIDLDFLRPLPPDMRNQAVQHLIAQNRPAASVSRPAPQVEMDPATFIATIVDDNVRDDILMNATPEFLALLPPEYVARADTLRNRMMMGRLMRRHGRDNPDEVPPSRPVTVTDPIESSLLLPTSGDSAQTSLIQLVHKQVSRLSEDSIEWFIRLLYLNSRTTIPLNPLFINICSSKHNLFKVLSTLLFVLSKHSQYEKYYQSQEISASLSACVSETKLLDVHFPPICLYQGLDNANVSNGGVQGSDSAALNHLTYSIIALRIFSLLSWLLKSKAVNKYFFMTNSEIQAAAKSKEELSSVRELREKLGGVKMGEGSTPLTELLLLLANPIFHSSERHLEAVINFLSDLFRRYEKISQDSPDKSKVPTVSHDNVKQLCQVFYFEVMNEQSSSKLADILLNLSQVGSVAFAMMDEIKGLLEAIARRAVKEWSREARQFGGVVDSEMEMEDRGEEYRVEVKFGMIMRLIKRIHDGHSPRSEEEQEGRLQKLYMREGDAIEEFSPVVVKRDLAAMSPEEKLSHNIREAVRELLGADFLIEAFDCLTHLITVISKRSTKLEGNSRKSQLLLKLVPSIESMIIAYDYTFRDAAVANELMLEIKKIREEKPEGRAELGKRLKRAYVFYKFLDENHAPFNNLIRQMSPQTFQSVIKPFVMRFPMLLDFENKRNYFRSELRKIRGGGFSYQRLNVRRENIFNDSYSQLSSLSPEEMKGKFRVNFKEEVAADAGGVTREWFTTLSRAMFNPIIGMFKKSARGNTYQPDPKSEIEPNHLNYFKFIGRIIGKAILEGQYLECYFTRALYKTLVGQPLTLQDMADYDREIFDNLVWLRDNDADSLCLNFTCTIDYFGTLKTQELIEGGANTAVTNENKNLFINRMCKAKLYDEIKSQIEALQKGINDIIPQRLLSVFDYREIELMISGLPDFDLEDMRKNTHYHEYTDRSPVIVWFWEIMEKFSSQERALFLQFVTGSSKVPLDGWRSLPGASGVQPFNIHKAHYSSSRLPTSHTCFNQLDLPEYPSKEVLQEKLFKAIKEGSDHLGLL